LAIKGKRDDAAIILEDQGQGRKELCSCGPFSEFSAGFCLFAGGPSGASVLSSLEGIFMSCSGYDLRRSKCWAQCF
jgi:hypothetical protein